MSNVAPSYYRPSHKESRYVHLHASNTAGEPITLSLDRTLPWYPLSYIAELVRIARPLGRVTFSLSNSPA